MNCQPPVQYNLATGDTKGGACFSTDNWMCPKCHQTLSVNANNEYTCESCNFNLAEQNGIWTSDQGFVPERFSHNSRNHLYELEGQHFWFKPRAQLFERIINNKLGSKFQSAIELGCGNGRFLPILNCLADCVVGVEGHFPSLEFAKQSAPTATLLHGDVTQIPLQDGLFDFACAFDVLEHVPPEQFLAEIRRLLRPGGFLLLSVPAFQSLWSRVDEQAGHRCRYQLDMAQTELQNAGFRIMGFTHYQFLLFPLVWLSRRLVSGRGRNRLEARPSMPIIQILGAINSLEVNLLSNFSLPVGSSLILWTEVS